MAEVLQCHGRPRRNPDEMHHQHPVIPEEEHEGVAAPPRTANTLKRLAEEAVTSELVSIGGIPAYPGKYRESVSVWPCSGSQV